MIVQLRNPKREVEMQGPMSVVAVLRRLNLDRETVLVIRNGTLVPGDDRIEDDDVVEIRSVISGGSL